MILTWIQFAETNLAQAYIRAPRDGQILKIHTQVDRHRQVTNQAGENLDRRVIEVKVRLSNESSHRVAAFTNLQVQGKIQQILSMAWICGAGRVTNSQ